MIKFQEIKMGDIVMADFEGKKSEGSVVDLNWEDKEVCVETEVQEFWFKPDDLYGVPLDDAQLMKLNFEKIAMEDGSLKYMRGPFRILLVKPGDFSKMEIWYREDRRHIHQPLFVHELQNHFHQMTKVDLTR